MNTHGRKTYVYQIFFPDNGKKYFGITLDFERRKQTHLTSRKRQKVHKAIRKYDKNVIFSIVAVCQYRREAEELEALYIKKFQTFKSSRGYNRTLGGDGGKGGLTQEAKERIALVQGAKKFHGYTLDGVYIGTWINAAEAARELNIHRNGNSIRDCLHKRKRVASGYYFCYDGELQEKPRPIRTRKGMRLTKEESHSLSIAKGARPFKVTKNGEMIGEFGSAVEAASALNITSAGIRRCLSGARKTYYDYVFTYIAEKPNRTKNTKIKKLSQEEKDTLARKAGGIPIVAIKNGEEIGVYFSLNQAAEKLCVKRSNVHQCLKGIRRTTGGYEFKYLTSCPP